MCAARRAKSPPRANFFRANFCKNQSEIVYPWGNSMWAPTTLSLPLCLALMLIAESALAHGGGLNASGCHTNRKTGDYHCHRSAAPAPKARSAPQPLFNSNRAFRNCREARSAGAAPVYRGDPGYGQHLDRDNDGVGCE